MLKKIRNNKGGFSLVELLFAAALFAMLALIMGYIFQKGNGLFDVMGAQSQTQRNGRKIMHTLASTIRQARSSAVTIPASPSNNQISFDLPIYQTSAGICSAFASVVDGTSPTSCSTTTDCATACGGAGSMTCASNICRRTYTYAISSATGISQLVVTAPGESSKVVGNRVQSVTFQNRSMDANLQSNEIRMTLVTSGVVISEKRTHTLTLNGVVQIRN